MIYVELFYAFLCVGCFAFGGAYGAIPLIRETVLRYGWVADDELSYMIAISESTPGPIMVNLATYIGSQQAGFIGAFLAMLAVVLPSFIVILIAANAMERYSGNKYLKAAMKGLKPCIAGIILAVGLQLLVKQYDCIHSCVMAVILSVILLCTKISPVKFIVISACLGLAVNLL